MLNPRGRLLPTETNTPETAYSYDRFLKGYFSGMTSQQRHTMNNKHREINQNVYNGQWFSLQRLNPHCPSHNDRPITPGTNVYAPPYVPGEPLSANDEHKYTAAVLREGTVRVKSGSQKFGKKNKNVAAKDLEKSKTPMSWPPPPSRSVPEPSTAEQSVPGSSTSRPTIPPWSTTRPSIPGTFTLWPSIPEPATPTPLSPCSSTPRPDLPRPSSSSPSRPGPHFSRTRKPLLRATDDVNRGRGSLTYASVASGHKRNRCPPGTPITRGHQIGSGPPDSPMPGESIDSLKPRTDVPGNLTNDRSSAISIPPNDLSIHSERSFDWKTREDFPNTTPLSKGQLAASGSQSDQTAPSQQFTTYSQNCLTSRVETAKSELSHFGHFYHVVPTSPNLPFSPTEVVATALQPQPTFYVQPRGLQALYSGVSYSSFEGLPPTLYLPKKFDSADAYFRMSYILHFAMQHFHGNIYEMLVVAMKDLEWGNIRFNALKTVQGHSYWSVTMYLEQDGRVKTLFGPEGQYPTLRNALEQAATKFIKTYLLDPFNFPASLMIFNP